MDVRVEKILLNNLSFRLLRTYICRKQAKTNTSIDNVLSSFVTWLGLQKATERRSFGLTASDYDVEDQTQTETYKDYTEGSSQDRWVIREEGTGTGGIRPFPEANIKRWQETMVEAQGISLAETVEYPIPTVGYVGGFVGISTRHYWLYIRRKRQKRYTPAFHYRLERERLNGKHG